MIEETGMDEALAGLRASRIAVRKAVSLATYRSGALYQTTVRALASTGTHPPSAGHIGGTGPGPNVATGDYRRSITTTNRSAGAVAESEVSTNAVQANRLEFGFVGVDSLGRHYRQPAFPHWEPAVAASQAGRDALYDAAAAEIEGLIHG